MKTGTCKLCLTPAAELRDSHFLRRSFYALFRDGKNEPIRFSPESVYPTSKQIKDFVFCGDCEERFNRDGENWVRPLLPKVGGPFPLGDRLMEAAPLYRNEAMAIFPTVGNPELDPAKLMHFALGVFYKAAVHSWRGDSSEPYMTMEADDVEALRLYLLGKAVLPKNMVVCVTVDSLVVPLQSMNEPYRMADKTDSNVTSFGCLLPAFRRRRWRNGDASPLQRPSDSSGTCRERLDLSPQHGARAACECPPHK
jgi:hypothetical protein